MRPLWSHDQFDGLFSHEYLLTMNGEYATMWRQQQEKYREDPTLGSRPDQPEIREPDGSDDDDDAPGGGGGRPAMPVVNSAALLNGREAIA